MFKNLNPRLQRRGFLLLSGGGNCAAFMKGNTKMEKLSLYEIFIIVCALKDSDIPQRNKLADKIIGMMKKRKKPHTRNRKKKAV